MDYAASNRREAGRKLVSSTTTWMLAGALGLTGSVAVIAQREYAAQHAAASSQSNSNSVVPKSGGNGGGFQPSSQAPSSSPSPSSPSSLSPTPVVSGGS